MRGITRNCGGRGPGTPDAGQEKKPPNPVDSGIGSRVYTHVVGEESKAALRSGDLARLVGVSPDTLRFYERKGLFAHPPRSANGYRCYGPDSVARVRLIRAALSIGFNTSELARVLALRDAGGAPCAHVRDLADRKLRDLDRHLRELLAARAQLRAVLRQWDATLKKTPSGKRAGLLEALAGSHHSPVRNQHLRRRPPLRGKRLSKE